MKIIFESPDPQAAQMRVLVERRVRNMFKRLDWLTSRIQIHLSDINGADGGIDKRCQIEVSTNSGSPVVATSFARSWLTALQSALTRVARSLLHNMQPARQLRIRNQRMTAIR